MNWQSTLLAGLRAAAMGSLIGTSLLTVFTTIIGVIGLAGGSGDTVILIFLPFLIGLAVAILGLVLIGAPVTWWLRRKGDETRAAYLSTGLIGGGVLAMIVTGLVLGGEWGAGYLFFGFFGAATGGATGHFWWRYAREPRINSDLVEISDVFG